VGGERIDRMSNGQLAAWRSRHIGFVFQLYNLLPVLTAEHAPIFWRYDLNYRTNPHLMERLGVNAAFNPGAMWFNGKFILMARVEGVDRKSFFAVPESSAPLGSRRSGQDPSRARPNRLKVNRSMLCPTARS
jgi:hypothetical protein